MGKQAFNQAKKILGILLVVFFVATLTSSAIGADVLHRSNVTSSAISTDASQHSNNGPQKFSTEQAAKSHCPTDTVVWLNLATNIYHYKGQNYYGNTKSGAYVCHKEADKAGARAPKGSQKEADKAGTQATKGSKKL